MRLFTAFTILAPLALALPTSKRQMGVTDVQVLQYALTLEHLEDFFYQNFLGQFSQENFAAAGQPEWVRQRFEQIASHEKDHVSLLTHALGDQAVKPCTYAFPVTDVTSFLGLATLIENVGVSAYLGAAACILDKTTLTIAGSILTTEARHQAWMNSAVLPEAAWSQAYDTPLSFNEVFSIASAFITSCPPENPALPFKAFPKLEIAPDGTVTTTANTQGAFVQVITGLGSKTFPVQDGKVTLPAVQGISYAVLTSSEDSAQVNDGNTLAGPMIFNNPLPANAPNPVPIL